MSDTDLPPPTAVVHSGSGLVEIHCFDDDWVSEISDGDTEFEEDDTLGTTYDDAQLSIQAKVEVNQRNVSRQAIRWRTEAGQYRSKILDLLIDPTASKIKHDLINP
jgi:hypothetical protein